MDYWNDTESNDELCARARAEERTITSEVNRDQMKSRKNFRKNGFSSTIRRCKSNWGNLQWIHREKKEKKIAYFLPPPPENQNEKNPSQKFKGWARAGGRRARSSMLKPRQLPRIRTRASAPAERGPPPELKGSIGEGPNHSNFSDRSFSFFFSFFLLFYFIIIFRSEFFQNSGIFARQFKTIRKFQHLKRSYIF